MADPSHHLIDTATGEIAEATDSVLLERISHLERDLTSAERDLRSKRRRITALEHDHQAEAEAHGLWPLGERCFAYHAKMLNHPRAEWTWQRFELWLPCVKARKIKLVGCLRAIAGMRASAWHQAKGLTTWEDVFGDRGKVERCIAKCPSDWTIPAGAAEFLPQQKRPAKPET